MEAPSTNCPNSAGPGLLVRAGGLATLAAGLCYFPLGTVDGWQSIADIGTGRWWLVQSLAGLHHVLLLPGLIGIYAAALRRAGAAGLAATIVAGIGNTLASGAAAVQLTVLPALAAHPEGASALDCTPFYRAATASAAALIAAACEPWQFDALKAWVGIGRFALLAGSLWVAVELMHRTVWKAGGTLLAAGWTTLTITLAVPLPGAVASAAYLAIAAGYAWTGLGICRRGG